MLNFPRFFLIKGHPEDLVFQPLENLFRIAAGVNERVAREGWMPKSSSLPYPAPFRYTRPAQDLQAMLGAQTGNPPILPVEGAPKRKPARTTKKRPSAVKKVSKAGKAVAATKAAKPVKKVAKPTKAIVSKPKAAAKKKASGKR
jgi:hypothetical protein